REAAREAGCRRSPRRVVTLAKAKRNGAGAAGRELHADGQSTGDGRGLVDRVHTKVPQVSREVVLARVAGGEQRRRRGGGEGRVDPGPCVPGFGYAIAHLAEVAVAVVADARRVDQVQ